MIISITHSVIQSQFRPRKIQKFQFLAKNFPSQKIQILTKIVYLTSLKYILKAKLKECRFSENGFSIMENLSEHC